MENRHKNRRRRGDVEKFRNIELRFERRATEINNSEYKKETFDQPDRDGS